jgi:hypothetical protein
MGKRRNTLKAKRLALRTQPTLLTEISGVEWSGGVLFVSVESGSEAGALALGPNTAMQLWQAIQGAMRDNVAPFNRTRAELRHSLADEEKQL